MRKAAILLITTIFLSACATGQQMQKKTDQEFKREGNVWAAMGKAADIECPMVTDRKQQIERQQCLNKLILEHVRPEMLYPDLVDTLLASTSVEAQNYADGDTNKETFVKNINDITQNYWDSWWGIWDIKIEKAHAGEEGRRIFGSMLLGGVQGYNAGEQRRREAAEINKTLHCTTYGNSTTCNEY